MNTDKFKIFYHPWPHIIFDDFLNYKECEGIIKEILNQPKYDDKVMVNRNRIFKGSKNFKNILSKSPNMKHIYEYLNKFKTFKVFNDLFDQSKIGWTLNEEVSSFSDNYSGKQKDDFFENFIKFLASIRLIKTSMNLDIDFSVSGEGYARGAHRDRETRVLNFLIYLNEFNREDGGLFELYDNNFLNFDAQDQYPRFPDIKNVFVKKTILPKVGKMIVFLSTPDSYHAASQFLSKTKKRVFIYGSYSLNKKTIWSKS